ncbi:nuclear transport factor 2 family protein [Terriglobus roseus]|uniref:SnoaL-like domain-containing protein n=1 Tax=Terriglobus roseus TaxID=392734 RepID=A0A1H4T9R3_9BACT|nr:nuclear transport factor 2 family protein [Terriglobus roseus]SEC53077.1 SnoaL-like domain-containing protein [Terriglobus roseus]
MATKQEAWNLYERYVQAWAAIPREERAAIADEVLADDLHYFTPQVEGSREAAIADMQGFQEKFPGGRFDVEDGSVHHDVALFTWVLVQSDGTKLVKGHDQIRISAEGKIAALITFAPSTPKP